MMRRQFTIVLGNAYCPMLGSIRTEFFGNYYCTAMNIFDSCDLNKIVIYAHRTKRLELISVKSDDASRSGSR